MNARSSTTLDFPKRMLRSTSIRPPPTSQAHLHQPSTLSLQPSLPTLSTFATLAQTNSDPPDPIAELEYADEDEDEEGVGAEEGEDMIMDDGSSGETDLELGAAEAFREPSPDSMMLFEPSTSAYPVMPPYRLAHVSQSVARLALAALNVLSHYRRQLDQWEAVSKPSDQVTHASIVLDQCLLRLTKLLEPVERRIAQLLFKIMRALQVLDEDIVCNKLCTRNEVECTKFWSRLAQLADQLGQAEDRLIELSNQLSEIYDWIDGCLTPVLGRLAVDETDEANRSEGRNSIVSHLLDVQSYFCQTVDQLSWSAKVYRKLVSQMNACVNKFGETMVEDDGFVDSLLEWSTLSGASLKPMAESLIVLSSVASGIQTLTAGTIHELAICPR
ncbi:hypothetical protein CROQUDRAFT_53174 [Cronartium quercuum f. sp. fusiforme G11]|uniref:Uncharacterized protein n=1 Tax=Cronartium quercuum f. sp. fusiforme G11 TaxID=708437 RepID=A0A9P6NB26_9BASI|nr:hypothetical protein CROQUDRAFT_53174 [Cronartium quercuum f. sp. fusiforme G11]